MAEIDELLRGTLERVAVPGDPSGVAEAIRARVEAGDAGISATSSTAPGWGGGGAAGWLPWIGVVVAAGLVGGGVGWSGVAGAQTDEVAVVGYTTVLDASVGALECPGGPVVRTLVAGTRVLAVERSEDSGYLGLRDPDDFASTVWLPTSVLVIDAGQDAAALPVGDPCPVATLAAPIPVAPPEDTDRPKIQSAVATPSTIQSGFYLDASTVSVNATDDTGVTRISASWPAVGFIPAGGTTITGGSGTFTFGSVNWGSTLD